MGDSNFSYSLSNLICSETITHPNEDQDQEVLIPFSETEDEYIEALVLREKSFESRAIGAPEEADSLLNFARSEAVRWVLRMKACFGFGYQTVYLAMSYLERFLVHRSIDESKAWALKLLSVACLSLAAKMEECRPPALSEYQLEKYQFSSNVIQRMELLVLNTLEWRMCSVTPFAYLGYFASKFECRSGRKNLFSRAIGFIFAIIEVMNLLDCRPSTIAASAILAASYERLTKNSLQAKLSIISLPKLIETENIFSCYSMMIQREKSKPPKLLVSLEVSNICATSFSAKSHKRRRLQ